MRFSMVHKYFTTQNNHQLLIFKIADIMFNLQIFGACGGLRRHKDTNLHQPFNVHEPLDVSVRLFFIETHFLWHLYFLISEGSWFWNRKNVRMWFSKLSLGLISWWYFWQSNRRRFRSFQISKNFLGFWFFLNLFSLFFWLL